MDFFFVEMFQIKTFQGKIGNKKVFFLVFNLRNWGFVKYSSYDFYLSRIYLRIRPSGFSGQSFNKRGLIQPCIPAVYHDNTFSTIFPLSHILLFGSCQNLHTCAFAAAVLSLWGTEQSAVKVFLPKLSKPHVPAVVLQSETGEVLVKSWEGGKNRMTHFLTNYQSRRKLSKTFAAEAMPWQVFQYLCWALESLAGDITKGKFGLDGLPFHQTLCNFNPSFYLRNLNN